MTAAQPDNPVPRGARSLEVRWIFPGRLETAVAGWFARFPAESESREDAYLLRPYLHGLSVKIRGGGALEVKVHRGSPGILDVAERAHGRMESWQKWSFPCGPLAPGGADPAGWRLVRKRRRIIRFPLASGKNPVPVQVPVPVPVQVPVPVPVAGPGSEPGCAVELTEVVVAGETWWSLGFEATGPAEEFRSELEAAAALMFAQAPPGGVEFGSDDSRSFAEWLRSRPGSV